MDERSLARFMRKVRVLPNGCWQWTERLNDAGYGTFSHGGKRYRAHRAFYEHFVGPIPDGFEPDHRCHTDDLSCPGGDTCPHRACVNWQHLEPVTHRENALRGRSPAARNAAKAECKYGHPFDEANTYITPDGGRQCRTCREERAHEFQVTKRRKGPKPPPTHCPQGHLYEGDNLAFTKTGAMRCRQCGRDRARATSRARREADKLKKVDAKPAATHCPSGHEYTAENALFEANGRRRCRECNRLRCKKSRERQKAA